MDSKKKCSHHFDDVDRFCDTITIQMLKIMIIVSTVTSIVPSICSPIYCYFRDDHHIDPKCWYAPYKQTCVQILCLSFFDFKILFHIFFLLSFESSAPWNQNTLIGKSISILICAMNVTIYTYVNGIFMTFFITTSQQFDAFRIYLKGLIDELDDAIAIKQRCTNNDAIQSMFQHIACFHVATKG